MSAARSSWTSWLSPVSVPEASEFRSSQSALGNAAIVA